MTAAFQEVSGTARVFNRMLGWLASHGLGPGYLHELTVAGRKSGRLYRTPVNLIAHQDTPYLVAARGPPQGAPNAEAAGSVVLKRGARSTTYAIRSTALEERPVLLKLYLDSYPSQVQQFFAVKAGAPVGDFAAVAGEHPVYELIAKSAV